MKKLKSSLTNMVIVLTVITIIAGGALGYVNKVTSVQIEKINAENLSKGIKQVLGVDANADLAVDEQADGNFTIYNTEQGTAIKSVTNGFGGPLEVLVGFDSEGTIKGYTILAHAETPGLGAKAGEWFQQGQKGDIIGKNPATTNLTVSKDGGDIDAITASTITSRAFLLAVKNAYDHLQGADATTAATGKAQPKHEGCEGKHADCKGGDCEGKHADCKDGDCEGKDCEVEQHDECDGDCEDGDKPCKNHGTPDECDKCKQKRMNKQ